MHRLRMSVTRRPGFDSLQLHQLKTLKGSIMKLVKLPSGDYVNPDFVTSVIYNGYSTSVWVIGKAGYRTFEINFPGDYRYELSKIINA